jgi:hypothetical protein
MMESGDKGMAVVLRFRNGRTERVNLVNIDSESEQVIGVGDDEHDAVVGFGELKAVFFPRARERAHSETTPGSTIAVEFSDGEVIRGHAHYNPEKNGFFLYPLDRSKNDKVFVVSSAISSIEVETF